MRKTASMFFVCCVCLSVVFITATACQAVTITLDENGHGYANGILLQYGADANNGLHYNLGFPVASGDLAVYEVDAPGYVADVLRFVGNQVFYYSDGGDTDLKKYLVNMGRTEAEIKDMRSRVKEELFDVLTRIERDKFDLERALKRINKAMESVIAADCKR